MEVEETWSNQEQEEAKVSMSTEIEIRDEPLPWVIVGV